MAAQDVAQQAVDHTPAVLAFVGALLVAVTAAGTAQWRQRVQLRHEREQQAQQRAHGADQLSAQLAHDRALHDLEELRQVLDEAAGMTWQALDALADAWQSADEWATTPGGYDESSHASVVAKERRHAAFEAIWPMEGMLGRLALRIGDHSVTRAFADFHTAAKAAARAVPRTRPAEPGLERWKQEFAPALRAARQELVEDGKLLVGTQIATEP